jgi:hypothetical protein
VAAGGERGETRSTRSDAVTAAPKVPSIGGVVDDDNAEKTSETQDFKFTHNRFASLPLRLFSIKSMY